MTDLAQQKQRLRAKLLELRNLESAQSRAAADSRIQALVEELPAWQAAQTVFCYLSVGTEVDTRNLIAGLLLQGKTVCVPRCRGGGIMQAQVLTTLDGLDSLEEGVLGIPVAPAQNPFIEPEDLDLIVVPCLACDPFGYRLGYGGGYYDRYLALARTATSVILCRESLLQEDLPREEHDLPTNIVVTDKAVRLLPQTRKESL